jgi:hypothetical protein
MCPYEHTDQGPYEDSYEDLYNNLPSFLPDETNSLHIARYDMNFVYGDSGNPSEQEMGELISVSGGLSSHSSQPDVTANPSQLWMLHNPSNFDYNAPLMSSALPVHHEYAPASVVHTMSDDTVPVPPGGSHAFETAQIPPLWSPAGGVHSSTDARMVICDWEVASLKPEWNPTFTSHLANLSVTTPDPPPPLDVSDRQATEERYGSLDISSFEAPPSSQRSATTTGQLSDTQSTDGLTPSSPGLNSQSHEFKCLECSSTFSLRTYLNQHRKVHLRPYKCSHPFCKWSFQHRRDLTRHQKTHNVISGQDMQVRTGTFYYCEHVGCPWNVKGFQRQDNYQRHMRNKHRESQGTVETSPVRTRATRGSRRRNG